MPVLVQRLVLVAAGLALALAVAGTIGLYITDSALRETARTATAPDIGGPFSLTDHTGKPVSEADYRGKLMVVYFGYTFCPDVCPTGLFKISQALDALGADAAQVQPLFITVDPERDTVAALGDYVGNFHPSLVGLTGDADQIKQVAKAYRAYYAKAEPEDGADLGDDYLVDHTALTFVMGRDGRFRQFVSHKASVEELAEAIREHL